MKTFRQIAEAVELKLHRVCAWCGKTIEEGDPGAHTSHGMCDECEARENAKLDALEAQKATENL